MNKKAKIQAEMSGNKKNGSADAGAGQRINTVVMVLFFAAVALFLGVTLTGGRDIWWHLLTGRILWIKGFSALNADIFSHTTGGALWLYKDFLADIILYTGFNRFGYVWFAILKGAAVIAVAAGIHFALSDKYRRASYTVLAGGLAVAAIQYRLVERPIIFSLAMFPLLTASLERARRCSASAFDVPGALKVWLPPVLIVWLWVLLHRAAVVGLGLIFAYTLEQWAALLPVKRFSRLFGPNKSQGNAAAALAAFTAAVAVSFVNPSGIYFYTSSFAIAGNDTLRSMISEWAPISITGIVTFFPVTAVLTVPAFAGAVRLVVNGLKSNSPVKNTDPGLMHASVIVSFTLLLIFDSVRWVPQLSLFAALTLVLIMPNITATLLPVQITQAKGGAVFMTVVLGTVILLNNSFRFGTGQVPSDAPDGLPAGAVAFAHNNGLSGKLLNSLSLGGYILWNMWPDVKVSTDGRNDMVYSPALLTSLLHSQTDPVEFNKLVARTGADWVMASNLPGNRDYAFLFSDPAWMMVYWSEPAVIYVKSSAFPASGYPDLRKGQYKVISPVKMDLSILQAVKNRRHNPEVFKQMQFELKMMQAAAPDGLRSNVALAVYYHFMGKSQWQKRDAVVNKILTLYEGWDGVKEFKKQIMSAN